MDEKKLVKILDFTFLGGKYDNPLESILRDVWSGFACVGLFTFCSRNWNIMGLRGLWTIMEFVGIWLLGLLLRLWYSSTD